jgi:hypothetical protein
MVAVEQSPFGDDGDSSVHALDRHAVGSDTDVEVDAEGA